MRRVQVICITGRIAKEDRSRWLLNSRPEGTGSDPSSGGYSWCCQRRGCAWWSGWAACKGKGGRGDYVDW